MKKLTLSIFACVLFVFILSSCISLNPTDNTSQSSNISSLFNPSNSPTTDDLQYYKSAIEGFLSALMNKDIKQIGQYLNVKDIRAYELFNSVNIESYSIFNENHIVYNDVVEYEVELNIITSKSFLFPNGRSRWKIDVSANNGYNIVYFQPTGSSVNRLYFEEQSENVYFCFRFSTFFNHFETVDNLNEIVPDPDNSDLFNHFCHNLISFLNNQLIFENDSVKSEQVTILSKEVLGISSLDLSMYDKYNKEDKTITHIGGGLPGYFSSLSSKTYDKKTKQSIITIDYYTDSACFLKGKTVEYVIRENDDMSFTLLSIKKMYDSGYALATY